MLFGKKTNKNTLIYKNKHLVGMLNLIGFKSKSLVYTHNHKMEIIPI